MTRKRSQPLGPITRGVKSAGKPSAGNRHAGFDVAGAGNVITGAGLRPMLKGMELCHRTLPSARQSSTLPDGEGLETGCALSSVPRQLFTRQNW